jgi:hypothetical protein
VLCNEDFQNRILDQKERKFLNHFLIPTYTYIQGNENVRGGTSKIARQAWYYARRDKESWLLKHCLLGKSEKVFAGCHCTQEEWHNLFESGEIQNMVLQPFIKQKTVEASIKDDHYNDYVTGTLLCFDNNFFGPGLFRTSSFDVTNKVDDRKIAQCYSENKNFNRKKDFIL